MINMNNRRMNKKGQMTMFIIFGFLVVLGIVFFFLVFGIFSSKVNSVFDKDIDIGQVNLKEVNSQSFGVFNSAFINKADMIGIFAIFGMVLGLFLSSYFLRNSMPKWYLVFDILVIVGVFIFALYLSKAYLTVLDGLHDSGEYFLEDSMPKTSNFMLNLPIYVAIIGAIMMILFHSSLTKKEEEQVNLGLAG